MAAAGRNGPSVAGGRQPLFAVPHRGPPSAIVAPQNCANFVSMTSTEKSRYRTAWQRAWERFLGECIRLQDQSGPVIDMRPASMRQFHEDGCWCGERSFARAVGVGWPIATAGRLDHVLTSSRARPFRLTAAQPQRKLEAPQRRALRDLRRRLRLILHGGCPQPRRALTLASARHSPASVARGAASGRFAVSRRAVGGQRGSQR